MVLELRVTIKGSTSAADNERAERATTHHGVVHVRPGERCSVIGAGEGCKSSLGPCVDTGEGEGEGCHDGLHSAFVYTST